VPVPVTVWPFEVPEKFRMICWDPLPAVNVIEHVVDWPAASDATAHVTVPPDDEPVMLVTDEPPVFVIVTSTVDDEPAGMFGPGAVPAGWPLIVGVPTVSEPFDGTPPT